MRRHKAWVAFGACWLLAAATLVLVAGAALGGWGAEPHAEADVLFGAAAVMITAPLIPLMGLFFMFCLYCMWIGLALNLAILEFVWLRLPGLGSWSSRGRAQHRAAYAAPRGGPDPHGYYTALGVDPRSSHRLIRVAYRRQALRNHPDRGGSVRRMQTINEAWAVVGDSEKRRAYDAGAAAVSI